MRQPSKEAVAIFRELNPDVDMINTAAERVVEQVVAAAKDAELTVTRHRKGPWLFEHGVEELFLSASVGRVWIEQDGKVYEVEGIEFDDETKEFVGSEEDTRRVPVPGEIKPRRAAVAVVAAEVVRRLKGPQGPDPRPSGRPSATHRL